MDQPHQPRAQEAVMDQPHQPPAPRRVYVADHLMLATLGDGLIGEAGVVEPYRVTTDEFKKVVKTLLEALSVNEKCGICFGELTEENVVVSPYGRVKFRNVNLVENLEGDALLARLRMNYEAASEIITGMFDSYKKQDEQDEFLNRIPPDVQHLLNCITNRFEARAMFHIHGSLIPVELHPFLYKRLYDHFRFSLPKHELICILEEFPYANSWQDDIVSNMLLMISFDRFGYEVPVNEDQQISLTQPQVNCLRKLGLNGDGQAVLDDHQLHLIQALLFCDFLRHSSWHRSEAFNEWNALYNKAQLSYTMKSAEQTSLVRFPLVIPYVQLKLVELGKINEVPMDELF